MNINIKKSGNTGYIVNNMKILAKTQYEALSTYLNITAAGSRVIIPKG